MTICYARENAVICRTSRSNLLATPFCMHVKCGDLPNLALERLTSARGGYIYFWTSMVFLNFAHLIDAMFPVAVENHDRGPSAPDRPDQVPQHTATIILSIHADTSSIEMNCDNIFC